MDSLTALPADLLRIESAVREILEAIGEDTSRPGLADTPARVAKMYAEIFSGMAADPASVLDVLFEEGHDELEKARTEVDRLLALPAPDPLPPEMDRELRRIVAAADKACADSAG